MNDMITSTYRSDDVHDIPKPARGHFFELLDGIERIDTWIGLNGRRHFQVLKTENESLLQTRSQCMKDHNKRVQGHSHLSS